MEHRTSTGRLYSLDADTGAVLWLFHDPMLDPAQENGPVPRRWAKEYDEIISVWGEDLGNSSVTARPALLKDGTIVAATDQDYLLALAPAGEEK
ncbi:MAG: PQQ-like beta-propeller repeat protein [Deltaproteobacteria bacterium]|nr:PQQ-like beta-propeller repeat protein [Deltaproteobacteria bacterium]